MNKRAIFSVLIFCCSFINLMAVEITSIKTTHVTETKPKGERCFGLGAQATSLSLIGTGTTFGIGANGLFSATGKKQAYFVDFNCYFPCHSQKKEVLYYIGTLPDQFQKKINVDYKI